MSLYQRLSKIPRSQPPPRVMFGPWLPDLPPFMNPGVILARNVTPASMSYRPFNAPEVQSDALDARALGAIATRDASSNSYVYAGDATKLYQISGQTVTDKSKLGNYSTASDEIWEFADFEGQTIGTNYADDVQAITTGGAGLFADLITSTEKPKARHIGKIRDFLFLGNVNSPTDGVKTNRVHWSAFRDGADFDPDSTTQSDFDDIADGGEVQQIIGGVEFGLVFMQSAVQRVTFTGDAKVFSIFPIDRKRGTPIPSSAIGHGRNAFFISEEGFYANNGSGESVSIGHDQVDRWFWDQFDVSNKAKVSAGIDPINKLVAWAFPGEGSAVEPNRVILYNWENRRWAYVDLDLEILTLSENQATTLEALDSVSASIDTLTPSLDSPVWQGGQLQFAAFDTDHKLNFFSGSNMAASVRSGDMEMSQGRRSLVNKLRPLCEGSAAASALAGRARLADMTSFDPTKPQDSAGEASHRNDARYHRFEVSTNAGDTWDHIQGVEAESTTRGKR